jgi:hypothetical protein
VHVIVMNAPSATGNVTKPTHWRRIRAVAPGWRARRTSHRARQVVRPGGVMTPAGNAFAHYPTTDFGSEECGPQPLTSAPDEAVPQNAAPSRIVVPAKAPGRHRFADQTHR